MIVSSGIDIIEVNRVKAAVKKWGKDFLNRVFTEREVKYSKGRRFAYQHLAARFAAKEAVLKAFGGGWIRDLPWKDVEIINDRDGKPEIRLSGEAKKLYKKLSIKRIVISMSHTKDHAVANAILIKKD